MVKKSGIYWIRQRSLDRVVYIGSSIDVQCRLSQHIERLQCGKHHNKALQRIYSKFGGLDFEFKKVASCSEKNLTAAERAWIAKCNPLCNGKGKASRRRVSNSDNGGNFIHKPEIWTHWFWND